MHLAGRNSPIESQKCVQLDRAVGEMLSGLSDKINHVTWMFSKKGSIAMKGSEDRPTYWL